MHHPTKFQADIWNPERITVTTSSIRPGPALSWKISKFRGTHKKWQSMAILNCDLLRATVNHSKTFQADMCWSGNIVVRGIQTDRLTYKQTVVADGDRVNIDIQVIYTWNELIFRNNNDVIFCYVMVEDIEDQYITNRTTANSYNKWLKTISW